MLTRLRTDADEGVTLVELLVVIVLLAVVGSVVVQGLVRGFSATAFADNRITALTATQTAVERLTRQIRVADSRDVNGGAIRSGSPTQLVLDVFPGTTRERYTWTVTSSASIPGTAQISQTRAVWTNAAADTAVVAPNSTAQTVVMDGLLSTATRPVFAYYNVAGGCMTGCQNSTGTLLTAAVAAPSIPLVAEVGLTVRRAAPATASAPVDANTSTIEVATRVTLRNAP